jgi:hypothetical protein
MVGPIARLKVTEFQLALAHNCPRRCELESATRRASASGVGGTRLRLDAIGAQRLQLEKSFRFLEKVFIPPSASQPGAQRDGAVAASWEARQSRVRSQAGARVRAQAVVRLQRAARQSHKAPSPPQAFLAIVSSRPPKRTGASHRTDENLWRTLKMQLPGRIYPVSIYMLHACFAGLPYGQARCFCDRLTEVGRRRGLT